MQIETEAGKNVRIGTAATANAVVALEHADTQAGSCEVSGKCQTVVTCTNDNSVKLGHVAPKCQLLGLVLTPSPRMNRARICTGSRSVVATAGLLSIRAAIRLGPSPFSADAASRSKSASSAAQELFAMPAPREIATRSAAAELAVGCEPVIW